jgi:phenol/toluene 2-monooxygenase (NADH) P4/A4
MAMTAAYGNYDGPIADAVENFHGNQLVYVAWDKHLMFPCGAALPLPPQMPFGALVKEVLPTIYAAHPDFEKINWDKANWLLNGQAFRPKLDASLADNGVGHKSLIRLATPGLNGVGGSGF